MENDKLGGMFEAMKGIASIQETMNSITATQEKLKKIANPFYGKESLLGVPKAFSTMTELANQFKSPFIDSLKPLNDIRNLNNVSERLFSNQVGLSALNSGMLKELTRPNPLSLMYESINDMVGSYNNHLRLSEQISNSLSGILKINNSFSGVFNSNNFLDYKKLTKFDIYSSNSFISAIKTFNYSEDDFNEALLDAENEFSENTQLNEEILSFQATAIALQTSGSTSVTNVPHYKIYDLKDLAEWFLNKILIKKLKLNVSTAYAIIYVVIPTVMIVGVFKDLFLKENGSKIYNAITDNDPKIEPKQIEIIKYIKPSNEINDFTIDSTPIYLRSSDKTKSLGKLKANTTVLIIKIVNKWCLVEGVATIKTKKNKHIVFSNKTVRGWVKKEHLDMFQ